MSQDGSHGRYAGGAVAGGRYQLRDLLGEGGMASVYLAYDAALDRQVAIKTLHTELGREQSFRERFRREAQAVAKLQHTNIVSVFDTGEDELGGALMPYIVMEYVEGLPLGSVLREDVATHGAMPTDKALKVTADVLAALETSHEMGLVHRDIKPGNVMITKRGVVKVMDFGIARAMQSGVTSMTQTGMVVGTPQYLSPEQALGRGVDARSDLYSVGIMLFQLLTGRLPFDAESALAIAYAHVQEQPPAPSTLNRSVSPAVDALVARALRKNPNERFPSAAAMRDEVFRVLNAQGPAAAPVIVAGGPANSGAGVGAAVFPPVDQQAPPTPYGIQTPYPAHQQPQPHQPGPYGVPTQAPGYGYPQTAPPAYQQTPPPYAVAQTASGGAVGPGAGKPRRNGVILGSAAVALVAVAGLAAVLLLGGGGNDEPEATDDTGGSSAPAVAAEHKGPERNRTMDTQDCTKPSTDVRDPEKVSAPDFVYKDLLSAKACADAAGWTLKVIEEPGNTYAEDQVVKQFPTAGTAIDPQGAHIELSVSTGDPN
ncbi:protein kinase [Streptomyces sp. NBC_00102]|uniref:protein kinase domain-containing protein n=1 Tax=Streptomyces sp. NBC_00102 TaxID=2975652 RepID=UPI002255B9DD|nr:protein kinase [Streptomyces sp. NBC_00102]MCX5398345.1 protein kinase [Streptomyces sp. NBC_00102]